MIPAIVIAGLLLINGYMNPKENDIKSKKNRERSIAYPAVTLESAIELAKELLDKLGKGPYSREESAKALGHLTLTGPATRKVASLVHYGLLERSGNTYSLGELSQDILIPVNDEQKSLAIITAVQRPKLFANLIQRYQGQSLPAMLGSILVREKISHSVAEDVASTFKESLRFAGLLENGVIKTVSKISDKGDRMSVKHNSNFPGLENLAPSEHTKNVQEIEEDFIFKFSGGIQLIIPRNEKTSEAIIDGELRVTRKALSDFADKFVVADEGGRKK